jgi:hypothetical protein
MAGCYIQYLTENLLYEYIYIYILGSRFTTGLLYIQYGLVLRQDYVFEYLAVNQIVVKLVLFKWFKLR